MLLELELDVELLLICCGPVAGVFTGSPSRADLELDDSESSAAVVVVVVFGGFSEVRRVVWGQ